MTQSLIVIALAVLIVMPVVAILLMGLQRASSAQWQPRRLALAALTITVVLVLAYLVLT